MQRPRFDPQPGILRPIVAGVLAFTLSACIVERCEYRADPIESVDERNDAGDEAATLPPSPVDTAEAPGSAP